MAIQQFPVINDGGIDFVPMQSRLTEVGRIRFGVYNADGRRPEKIDTLRFTSEHPELIQRVAAEYGGDVQPFAPQGSRGPAKEWEVVTTVSAIPVIVPQQQIEPWLEAWRPGTCIRRCDGVTEVRQRPQPCPCAAGEVPVKDVCKPVVRVSVMLDDIRGTGTWRFESHGRHAVQEITPLIPYIAAIPGEVLAILRLRREERRPYVEAKGKHVSTVFYVPYLHITEASSRQLIGAEQIAIEPAAPAVTAGRNDSATGARELTSAAQATDPGVTAGVVLSDADRHQILVAIEGAQTPERLMEIYTKLRDRGVKDERVKGALTSKQAGFDAAAEIAARQAAHQASLRGVQRAPLTLDERRRLEALRSFRGDPDYRQALGLGATHEAIAEAGGVTHWLAGYDQAHPPAEREYAVGDTVAVAGIEFTKVSDDPFGPGPASDLVNAVRRDDVVDAVVVSPDGDPWYDTDSEFAALFNDAGPLGWTTADVHDRIKSFCHVERSAEATGTQLHDMRQAMRAGTLQ